MAESDRPPHGKPAWLAEYEAGPLREIYYSPLPHRLMKALCYDWQLFVEINYLKFQVLVLGVCNEERREVKLNPLREDILEKGSEYDFYNDENDFEEYERDPSVPAPRLATGVYDRVVLLATDKQQVRSNPNPKP